MAWCGCPTVSWQHILIKYIYIYTYVVNICCQLTVVDIHLHMPLPPGEYQLKKRLPQLLTTEPRSYRTRSTVVKVSSASRTSLETNFRTTSSTNLFLFTNIAPKRLCLLTQDIYPDFLYILRHTYSIPRTSSPWEEWGPTRSPITLHYSAKISWI